MSDASDSRDSPLRGRVAEGATILVSILLAFGIDAWWDTRQDSAALSDHMAAVAAEMGANRTVLEEDAVRLARAAEAQRMILGLTGPTPRPFPIDSLAALIGGAFDGVPETLATGAIESLLASGTLARLSDVGLQARLVNWKGRYESMRSQSDVYRDARASLIEAVGGRLPLLDAAHVVNSSLPRSSFQFGSREVLADSRVEAHVANLSALSARLRRDVEVLIRVTDEVLERVGPEGW